MTGRANRPGLLLVVALVLGIVGMHALMGPSTSVTATPAHSAAAGMSGVVGHPVEALAASDVVADSSCAGCGARAGGHGSGHSVVSMCLAVLGAMSVLVLLAAALLRWQTTRSPSPRWAGVGSRVARGPPPQDVSLAALCVQRV